MDSYILLVTAIINLIMLILGFFHLKGKIKEVHLTMNSRLDELLKINKAASYAEGLKEGEKRCDAFFTKK